MLVFVGKFIFFADFYIFDMMDEESSNSITIILGRLFLMTTCANIDVYTGSLAIEIKDS